MKPRLFAFSLLGIFVGALTLGRSNVQAADESLPFVSPIFGDNMVLQRDRANTFWGWSTPGDRVRVQINEQRADAVADATGRWQVKVNPPRVGSECVVRIEGASKHVELKHVIVGDVWLCGGQSNMEFALPRVKNGAAEVAAANHPGIRLYRVPSRAGYSPVAVTSGHWSVCTPETVSEHGGFSAVAYFFARRVEAETGVPIGLIEDCLGGTPVESWMSLSTIEASHQFVEPLAELTRLRDAHAKEYGNYIMHWYDQYDVGSRGQTWADPHFDDSSWKPVHVPGGGFEEFGLTDEPAVVWFRKEIELPNPLPKGKAMIRLGVVERMETTYVNGVTVGASAWVENPRVYSVSEKLLKPGKNLVAVRVFKVNSKVSFLSSADQLHLTFENGPDISLAGDWKAAVSVDARPPHPLPFGFENWPVMPTVLYNGMINPIVPLALKGALWYQGEANSSRARQYRVLLPALIENWREAFGQANFPFLIASLPAFKAHRDEPGSDDWAELREAQLLTAKTVPHTWTAVTIDTGDANDIHPTDKIPVGERLAALALANVYGSTIPSQGPIFKAIEHEGDKLRIRFSNTDGGLKVHGETLEEFAVAGIDRQWHWAEAKVEGDTVVVSSRDVSKPVAVRYAWQANPHATLFNGAGFPAAPFRTDDWPGVTDNAKPW